LRKCKILFGRGCRSTYGLSDPIIRRLEKQDWCEVDLVDLIAGQYCPTVNLMEDYFISRDCDLFLAMADRIEMCAAVSVAFHYGVKIAHVYAGITNYPHATLDDRNRPCITHWSDIAFCEDSKSADVVIELWTANRRMNENFVSYYDYLKENNIYIVGITHLDDLEIDESLVPDEEYDLVLYNPPTHASELGNKTLIIKELDLLIKLLKFDKKTFWIDPNPDPYNHFIMEHIYSKNYHDFKFKYKLPRSQFLGLLKNCSRYITNSSNINYEARPLGLRDEQIIQVGLRNKNRSTPKKLEVGASQKIVDILKKWWENEGNS